MESKSNIMKVSFQKNEKYFRQTVQCIAIEKLHLVFSIADVLCIVLFIS